MSPRYLLSLCFAPPPALSLSHSLTHSLTLSIVLSASCLFFLAYFCLSHFCLLVGLLIPWFRSFFNSFVRSRVLFFCAIWPMASRSLSLPVSRSYLLSCLLSTSTCFCLSVDLCFFLSVWLSIFHWFASWRTFFFFPSFLLASLYVFADQRALKRLPIHDCK